MGTHINSFETVLTVGAIKNRHFKDIENIRYKIHDEDNKQKKTKKLNPEDLNCE
jgi:hypothetical protein